jgi:DNA-binding CsgD family transcriptional regulator
VFVTDPTRTVKADVDVIRQFCGLTPTEATIAVKLAAGSTLSDIAEELASSQGTVRWHLKPVLAKTGTKRQAELVRVLTTSPAVIRRGAEAEMP